MSDRQEVVVRKKPSRMYCPFDYTRTIGRFSRYYYMVDKRQQDPHFRHGRCLVRVPGRDPYAAMLSSGQEDEIFIGLVYQFQLDHGYPVGIETIVPVTAYLHQSELNPDVNWPKVPFGTLLIPGPKGYFVPGTPYDNWCVVGRWLCGPTEQDPYCCIIRVTP